MVSTREQKLYCTEPKCILIEEVELGKSWCSVSFHFCCSSTCIVTKKAALPYLPFTNLLIAALFVAKICKMCVCVTANICFGHNENTPKQELQPHRPAKRDSDGNKQGDVCVEELLRKQLFTGINSMTAASQEGKMLNEVHCCQ